MGMFPTEVRTVILQNRPKYERVAQLVAHLTFNQVVGSSSLPTLTNILRSDATVAIQTHYLKVVGSTPTSAPNPINIGQLLSGNENINPYSNLVKIYIQ